ncbi:hypothetical protein BJY01DRAFT_235677 [Aspergillus pseudoustus]|uniref:Uncharacterized protein n=1 Tax=Aspergillus pseudoustus TaxID=1810923 RepID=A0ABR4JTL2_9EURO
MPDIRRRRGEPGGENEVMLGSQLITPRSFLFAIVVDVGHGGASCPLAVAYRQGCDRPTALWPPVRIYRFLADILALIEILWDPANRAMLEAERALAKDWYRRPSVPDSPQHPFIKPDRHYKYLVPPQPPLPWHHDALSDNSARCGDVQLQPLTTAFRADCTEYGLVVLDISNLDSVKYGIVAFGMHYMAEVSARSTPMNWDPIEDKPPLKEQDVVLDSPRSRVPLSIHQWLSKRIHLRQCTTYACFTLFPEQ